MAAYLIDDSQQIPRDEPLEAVLKQEAEAERARQMQRDHVLLWVGRLGLIAAILIFWELASGTLMNARYVSKPSEIATLLQRWFSSGEVWPHLRTTVTEVLAGYVLGVILGLLAAILLTFFGRIHAVLRPLIVAFYGIPKVALAPILVMWLGLDITPKVVIATVIVFFVIFMNTVAGLSHVRPELVDIARVMGASRLNILRTIMLPSAAPYILTAMRITIPDAVVGAIVGEFIAGSTGMGNLIRRSSSQLVTSGVFGGIFVLAMLVIIMRISLTPLERRLLSWRENR
jgi:NitT/TauT family transport system permease protein